MPQLYSAITGCMLGTAVGDAIGLPYEGLSPQRALRMLGPPSRHRFLFGHGMISDDTEHTCMAAQALIASGSDPNRFLQDLASRMRWWFMALPAGLGIATAKSCMKLCIGIPPSRSGVFSAGNGPAMRSAVLGVAIHDVEQLRELVRMSTRLTHTDPKAEFGAYAVAVAANMAAQFDRVDPGDYLKRLQSELPNDAEELLDLLQKAISSVEQGESSVGFAEAMGYKKGVSGYVYQTVPVAVHAWLSHQTDFRAAITDVILCGGDADTTAAIVGGIVGAGVGGDKIPSEWLDTILDFPRSARWIERLAIQLADSLHPKVPQKSIGVPWLCIIPRNLIFLAVVLFHGFRRLAPPY